MKHKIRAWIGCAVAVMVVMGCQDEGASENDANAPGIDAGADSHLGDVLTQEDMATLPRDAGGDPVEMGARPAADQGVSADAATEVEACPAIDGDRNEGPLYGHRIQWSRSEDPDLFRGQPDVLLEHASVPDGVRRADGQTWVYYVNGNPGQHAVFIARLEGDRLVPFDCVRLDGRVIGDAVDPDIVQLPDGRFRLFYFYGWFTPERRPPPGGAPHPFFSAISDDGIHFEVESQILTLDNEGTDPTGIRLPSGKWLLAATGANQVYLSTSDDGENFTWTDHVFTKGISELAYFPEEGRVRLYIGGRERVVWQSDDEGQTWEQVPGAVLPGPDPSVVPDGQGGWIMFYKTMEPGSGPMRPMPGGQ